MLDTAPPFNPERLFFPAHPAHPAALYPSNPDPALLKGPVIYWMSREQRVFNNQGLIYSMLQAQKSSTPLVIAVFFRVSEYENALSHNFAFMDEGLVRAKEDFKKQGIPFYIFSGSPDTLLPVVIKRLCPGPGLIVTDLDPSLVKRGWIKKLLTLIKVPLVMVDSRNIVPLLKVSGKKEFAARTIRPKIQARLPEFLVPFPANPMPGTGSKPKALPRCSRSFDASVFEGLPIFTPRKMADNLAQRLGIRPGYKEALKILTRFIDLRADNYAQKSNDPNGRALSGLSPYLHFGHISSQEIALEIIKAPIDPASKDAFLEQLIVRRELADNFCWYEPAYMSVKSFPEWAVKTLKEHARDPRPLVYSLDQLENARTHDALWNACQLEMAHTGIMQGYLRMYWAKKILQWSPDYIQAHERVIRLNDKYSIDGRDSNGYTGAAWAVGGVHDRPWSQRAIFGKIRYMNRRGCERKFDVKAYIRAVEQKTGQPVSPDYPVAQY